MVKECALSTGNLPWGGLLRNIVDRITDRPDMTSAHDHGRKASTQQNQILLKPFIHGHVLRIRKFCIYMCKICIREQMYFYLAFISLFGSVRGSIQKFVDKLNIFFYLLSDINENLTS